MSIFGLTMSEEIINRVEKSGLIQINLDDFYPKGDRVVFDLSTYLKEGLILIEKEFRIALKEVDWSQYQGKYVAMQCTTDAIVPLWAFMLADSYLKSYATKVVMGNKSDLEKSIFTEVLSEHDFDQYIDKSVIVKGCGQYPIPESVFIDFTHKLQDYAKNIMFGEACSAVPLFKNPKK